MRPEYLAAAHACWERYTDDLLRLHTPPAILTRSPVREEAAVVEGVLEQLGEQVELPLVHAKVHL